MHWWVFILGILIGVIPIVTLGRIPTRTEKQAAERIRMLRDSRDAESAYADDWGAPRTFVERVLAVVSRVSEESFIASPEKMPADRLMPDDRLSEELAFHLDELSMDVLVMRLIREFGIRLNGRDFDECRTVGDVVHIMAAKCGH